MSINCCVRATRTDCMDQREGKEEERRRQKGKSVERREREYQTTRREIWKGIGSRGEELREEGSWKNEKGGRREPRGVRPKEVLVRRVKGQWTREERGGKRGLRGWRRVDEVNKEGLRNGGEIEDVGG